MQEANISKARELLKIKRDLRAVKVSISRAISDTTNMTLPFNSPTGELKNLSIEIRNGTLRELLDRQSHKMKQYRHFQ